MIVLGTLAGYAYFAYVKVQENKEAGGKVINKLKQSEKITRLSSE